MEKWVIMQELEDSNTAIPYRIVADEDRAYKLSDKLAKENPRFIFWPCLCEEEGEEKMKVYSLTQVCNMADVGCYGVFSTPAKATEFAIDLAKSNGEEYSEETMWDGFTKKVYCGDYEFEIWEHCIDE